MNPKYERKEGEDLYEYGLRLIEIKMEQKPEPTKAQMETFKSLPGVTIADKHYLAAGRVEEGGREAAREPGGMEAALHADADPYGGIRRL